MKEGVPNLESNKLDLQRYKKLQGDSMEELCRVRKEALDMANISVRELKADSADFESNRAKLNSEPGIVIANHPGAFDSSAILSLLYRNDILMMVNDNEAYEGTPIENSFVKAPHSQKEIQEVFDRIRKHIQNGGLFFMFPTAGHENEGGDFKFRSGLSYMLTDGTLKDDTMIYCFDIKNGVGITSQEDIQKRVDYVVRKKLYPDAHDSVPVPAEIILDERLTRGREWIEILKNEGRDKNIVLGDHYLGLFKETL